MCGVPRSCMFPPTIPRRIRICPQTLQAAQFDVERSSEIPRSRLSDYQLVIFNDWDLETTPPAFKDEVEKYVKQGGGLLVIAGERSIYQEGKTKEDALDRTLPATLAPPRSPEGTAVILIIDKSSSMEGRKIELARQAASGVVENLRPIDTVGVLMFDNSFEWAVTLRHAEDRVMIKRLIAGIRPDGGTQIAPALTEAYTARAAHARDLQTHRPADRRNLRGRRQHGSGALGEQSQSHHFNGRPGPGREPRLSGKDRAIGGRQIVLPERSRKAWNRFCCTTCWSTPAPPPSKNRCSRK